MLPQLSSPSRSHPGSLHRVCRPDAASPGPTGVKNEEGGYDPSGPFNGHRPAARLQVSIKWNEAATRKPVRRTDRIEAKIHCNRKD